MKPEDLVAFGEVVKTHVEPIQKGVAAIQETQGKHGERLATVENEVKNKGNCTEHAKKIVKVEEQAKTALKNAGKNWTFIRVLTVAVMVGLLSMVTTLLAWGLGLL